MMAGDELEADLYFSIIPEWILDAEISSNAVRLYAVLRRYADAHGACYPSRATLAARMRCSRDTVDRAVRELQEIRAIEIQGRIDEAGDRASNLYRLATAPPSQASLEVAAGMRLPGRKDAPTGGRKDAQGVAAGMRQESEPMNQSQKKEISPAHAGAIVQAYVDEFREAHGAEPPKQALGRIGRDARVMLADEARPWELVAQAAQEAARSGHPNLASALTRVLAGSGLSRRDRQLREGAELARELAQEEALEIWGRA